MSNSKRAIFRKELRLQILKLRGIVVVVHQFSKLKRILFQERSIFYFPLLDAGLSFWKIAFEIGLHTKNVRFSSFSKAREESLYFLRLPLFKLKLRINPSSSKTRSWVSQYLPLAIEKSNFMNAAELVSALSSLRRECSQISRFSTYWWIINDVQAFYAMLTFWNLHLEGKFPEPSRNGLPVRKKPSGPSALVRFYRKKI